MFNTSLTNEYQLGVQHYGWDRATVQGFVLNAVDATQLPEAERAMLRDDFVDWFDDKSL